MDEKKKNKKGSLGTAFKTTAAAMVAAATLGAGMIAPAAMAGGGEGNQPGTGGSSGSAMQFWQYKDDASGSWGPATSLDSVKAAMAAAGVTMTKTADQYDGPKTAQAALDQARQQCEAGFNQRHPDEAGQANCRVVAVGAVAGPNLSTWNASGIASRQTWIDNWNKYVSPYKYNYAGTREYVTSNSFEDDPSMSVDKLMQQSVHDDTTISIIVLDKYQPAPPTTPPPAPKKEIQKGTSADSMRNTTTITSETGVGGTSMTFTDTIHPNGISYSIENMKVTDNGQTVNGFTYNWDKAKNTVIATFKGNLPDRHTYKFSFDVIASRPDINKVQDQATVMWNEKSQNTESREFPTWSPNPDKSWIFKGTDGKWQAVIDPQKTNTTGADDHVFLDGDEVASAVNGTISNDLIDAPTKFSLTDDWAAADYVFDAADVKDFKVYMSDASSNEKSSVADIANKGTDVTDKFDITVNGTKAVALMKQQYLAELKGLKNHRQYTLIVPGKINFANGKGASQVRKDYGKNEGDEVTACAAPSNVNNGASLTNAGSQTLNNEEKATNEPKICIYVPPAEKHDLAEASQGGGQEDINGKTVFPGQKIEYVLNTSPKLPQNLAYDVKTVKIIDQYDQYFNPDKQTLEITDLASGKMIPKSQYTTQWDDAKHQFTVTFSEAYVKANWGKGANPKISVRFEGVVSKDLPENGTVKNQWDLQLNNSITPSNEVENTPPPFQPTKEDTQKDPSINIDGKTAMLGDTLYYRVTLDLKNLDRKDTAYNIQRAGIIDDYDDEYLTTDAANIEVLDDTGADVTSKFNIQIVNGVVYVFAKTVDTQVPATGETLKGDPQPSDLKAYSEQKLDPLKDAAIDQALTGHTYQVVMPMTVSKVEDGYTVKNTATQLVNDVKKTTNTVTNPLKEINPSKDVVVNMGDASANGKSIYLNSTFLYQLDSSVLPADRAYPTVTDWRIVDKLDTKHDQYTGQWAVYATRDLKDGDKTLAAKGARIAGSGVDSSAFGGDLFTVSYADDGTFTVTATQRYLDLVSASNAEAGWRAYIQCKRIATGERIVNKFVETLNGTDRPSNEVHTRTPDQTPSIDVEKYDIQSGETKGDRDDPKQALKMKSGEQEIGIKITNTGKVELTKLTLSDALLAGSGELKDIQYPKDWDKLVLKPGQSITLKATLTGVKEGDKHTNRVSVTGTPIVECPVVDSDPFDDKPGVKAEGPCYDTPVHDSDDWNGYRAKANPVARLASTGSGIALLAVLAVAALSGGVMLVVWARRPHAGSTGRHMPAALR